MTTTLNDKVAILADFWLNYNDDEDFQEFIEYNDLGLPLAYAIANDIVPATEMAQKFVFEAFDLLLAMFETEDTGFESLDEILATGQGNE